MPVYNIHPAPSTEQYEQIIIAAQQLGGDSAMEQALADFADENEVVNNTWQPKQEGLS